MKKITLLFSLLVTVLGFSQELVTNGDFQTGVAAPWYGNGANVVDLGGSDFINEVNVGSAGNAYDVNLSQTIVLENGKTYELIFDAFTDATTATRTIIAGLGQNNAPWSALTATINLTDTPQTFTYQFTINYGDGVDDRVLFDMGAETGFVYIDNVSVMEIVNTCANGIQDGDETDVDCGGSCGPCPSPPPTAAPDPPARDSNDVISVFSAAYSDVAPSGVNVFASASWDNFTIESTNDTRRLTAPSAGGGVQFEYIGVPPLDLTDFTHMHVDFYVEGNATVGSVFQIFLINFPSHPAGDGSYNLNTQFEITNVGTGSWVSGDVELSTFINGGSAKDKIALVQLVAAGPVYGPIYVDNIYFHKNTTLSSNSFEMSELKVFPNPTNGTWNIKSSQIINSVEVFDLLGKQVMLNIYSQSSVKIDASTLAPGIYIAKVNGEQGSKSIRLLRD